MSKEFQKSHPLARKKNEDIKPLDVYAEHAEIRHLVYSEIKKLHVTLDSNKDSIIGTIIDKFLDCVTPLKNLYDPGRLPVYTSWPKSAFRDKKCCVWTLINCLVQAYWNYESEYAPKERTVSLLIQLKEINECYLEMKVVGGENKGYWLEL